MDLSIVLRTLCEPIEEPSPVDRIGIVGLSWRDGGAEALARFTIPVPEREQRLSEILEQVGAEELVYLATCNRVEVLFAADSQTPLRAYRPRIFRALTGTVPAPGQAQRALRAWAGEGAVEHLFCVACGLDSARVGETEITGQVREAWKTAQSLGLTGPRSDRCYREALRIAAAVHASTTIAQGRTSLAEIAIDKARSRLRRTPGRAALVGVSPMTIRCGKALAEGGWRVVVANRSPERALALAGEIGGVGHGLEEFRLRPDPVEVVITATASKTPVLDRACLERLAARSPSGEPPLVIDMAIPPDVAEEDATAAGLPRIGMPEIIAEAESHRNSRINEAADARDMVDDALLGFRQTMTEWALSPMLGALQRRYRQTAMEGVERLMRKQLSSLPEDQRKVIEEWAVTLARRFAHVPSVGLRAVAMHKGLDAVDTFFSHADESLAREWKLARQGKSRVTRPPHAKMPHPETSHE